MNHPDVTGPHTATASEYSLKQTLLAGLFVTGAVLLAVFAVSAPGLTVSFLAGASTTGVVYRLSRRDAGEDRDRAISAPSDPQPRG